MELQDWGEALAYCKLTIPVYESMLSVSAKVLSEIIEFRLNAIDY